MLPFDFPYHGLDFRPWDLFYRVQHCARSLTIHMALWHYDCDCDCGMELDGEMVEARQLKSIIMMSTLLKIQILPYCRGLYDRYST